MKQRIFILLIASILCSLYACADKGGESTKMNESLFQDLVIDNDSPLSELCNTSYPLADLYGYFGYVSPNENLAYGTLTNRKRLLLSAVNDTFPVECTRQSGLLCCYSIYKVNEGGYFYVFWSRMDTDKDDEPFAYITTYILSLPNKKDFESLRDVKSTAQNVMSISTATEFCFVASSGVYSYSLLDDGNIMEIRYTRVTQMNSRDDLEVMNVNILSKEKAQSISYLSWIMDKDLP